MIYGNSVGGVGRERTYILVDEEGNEVPAVVVSQEVVFDAVENDIRIGKVAATANGITTGTKEIPAYVTLEGAVVITNGSKFSIPVQTESYNFTKLQCIICPFMSSIAGSVAAEKVTIGESTYNVNSTDVIASVSRDSTNQSIDLGITNNSGSLYLLRYFTYKEIF